MFLKGRYSFFIKLECFLLSLILLFVCNIFLSPGKVTAGPVGLSGSWDQRRSGQSDGEGATTFSEYYSLGFGREITSAINLNGSVNYYRHWPDNTEKNASSLSPSLVLSMANDIFGADLSGNVSESTNISGLVNSSRAWRSSFASKWNKRWWPNLSFSYGQGWSSNDLSSGSSGRHDTDNSKLAFGLGWDLGFAQSSYSFNNRKNNNNVQLTETDSKSHFAMIKTSKKLLNDKAHITFAQQYSNSTSSTTLFGSAALVQHSPTPEARGNIGIAINWTTPMGFLPVTINDPADLGSQVNIAIDADSKEVDMIYLYTDIDLTQVYANTFTWTLSSEGATGLVPWDIAEAALVGVTYNSPQKRFEIPVPSLKREYLILEENVIPAGPPGTYVFTRVEAYVNVTADENTDYLTSDSSNINTNVGLSYVFNDELSSYYRLSFDKSFSPAAGPDSDSLSHAIGLAWNPHRKFSSNLNLNQNSSSSAGSDNMSRSYSMGSSYNPISSLGFSLSMSRSESYQDDTRVAVAHNYSIGASASLYRDLQTGLDINYSTSERDLSGVDSGSMGLAWSANARLSPKMTMDISESYSRSTIGESNASLGSQMGLSWRPSDVTSIQSRASHLWSEEGDNSFAFGLTSAIALSPVSQFSLSYQYILASTATHSYSLGWSYIINQFFSMNSRGSFVRAETSDQWSVNTGVDARF